MTDQRTALEFERLESDHKKKFDMLIEEMKQSDIVTEEITTEMKEMAREISILKKEQSDNREQLIKLTDKCQDLEARSRRLNLRIVGVKEGREQGIDMPELVSKIIIEVFKLKENVRIDVAHRVGPPRRETNAPPRQIIAKFLDISTLEKLLKMIPHGERLIFEGESVRFYRDYPREVMEKRNQFKKASNTLQGQRGIIYGMVYPAKVFISYKTTQRSFRDPEKAFKYAQEIVQKIEKDDD